MTRACSWRTRSPRRAPRPGRSAGGARPPHARQRHCPERRMKRLALLKTLLEREQKRRDEQMANVRNAVANAEAQQQQADGLVAYRTEYCRKWSAQFQQAATIEILRSYQGFLSRLDQAITQQQSVLEHAHR